MAVQLTLLAVVPGVIMDKLGDFKGNIWMQDWRRMKDVWFLGGHLRMKFILVSALQALGEPRGSQPAPFILNNNSASSPFIN